MPNTPKPIPMTNTKEKEKEKEKENEEEEKKCEMSTTQKVFFWIGTVSTGILIGLLFLVVSNTIYNYIKMNTKVKTLGKNNKVEFEGCEKVTRVFTDILPETKNKCTCYFTHEQKLLGCTDNNNKIIEQLNN